MSSESARAPLLDDYLDAFAAFLRTGDAGGLARFCAPGAEPGFLQVYRNGFYRTCVDALRSNYPALRALLGDARFTPLARAYVDAHPPARPSLTGYGERFPAFLAQRAHDAGGTDTDTDTDTDIGTGTGAGTDTGTDRTGTGTGAKTADDSNNDNGDTHDGDTGNDKPLADWLADLALLDRAWLTVYFAAESTPLDGASVAALAARGEDPGALRPRLGDGAIVVASRAGVLSRWRALKERGAAPPRPAAMPGAPQQVLLWRHRGTVFFRALGDGEAAFLRALDGAASLAEAALAAGAAAGAAAAGDDNDSRNNAGSDFHGAGFDLADVFAGLLRHGVLTTDPPTDFREADHGG